MSVNKKRTIGPCRGVTWLSCITTVLCYVVSGLYLYCCGHGISSLYHLDPRFRPLLLKYQYILYKYKLYYIYK